MGRRHKAAEFLKQGFSPSQISKRMGISLTSVIQYLYHQVGEGAIKRSDIVFAIPKKLRQLVEAELTRLDASDSSSLTSDLRESGLFAKLPDLEVYLTLRDARAALGDLYELIRDIEVTLHDSIRAALVSKFGQTEWWRKGIPNNIRAECSSARELDPDPSAEPYCYTTLINLKEILDKNWAVFATVLPKQVAANKQELLSRLGKLNRIRNNVMHPVRGALPTEEDFQFVRELHEFLKLGTWVGCA